MKNRTTYSQDTYRLRKFKDILDFVKSLGLEERKKLILEIQLDQYFNELSKCEVVKDNG